MSSAPRTVYFNKATRVPSPFDQEGHPDYVGFQVPDDVAHIHVRLKVDESGWEWNELAERHRQATQEALRQQREVYLRNTDYADAMPPGPKREGLQAYRQWLRDLPQLVQACYYNVTPALNLNFDSTVVYPTP